jgi:hypothetical protein
MKLEDIIRVAFKPGERFYDHSELELLILTRYGFAWGRHMNSKAIRRAGLSGVMKKINGKAVRGFLLEIADYTLDQCEEIYNKNTDSSSEITSRAYEDVHKRVRFLIKDWGIIPIRLQLKYKKHKEQYLKEVITGAAHDTKWFSQILLDMPDVAWVGKDVDFVIQPARDIIKDLNDKGSIKRSKKPDLDKIYFILNGFDFVRINDFVYGKVVTRAIAEGDGLPDY